MCRKGVLPLFSMSWPGSSINRITTGGPASHDIGMYLGEKHGTTIRKVCTTTQTYCTSFLFSKVVEKLKMQVVNQYSCTHSCESRTMGGFHNVRGGLLALLSFLSVAGAGTLTFFRGCSDQKILLTK